MSRLNSRARDVTERIRERSRASRDAIAAAFRSGELARDVVVVVRFQGPLAKMRAPRTPPPSPLDRRIASAHI